ncbi:hypothetical protein PSU4_21290 [Pseudonocardia sulfidoxydans NBRC 16205]|uniref:Uncharacterized protein n=1 Tax=Pseudonocardia sulfidoxydans NBRC 16205 TaxID=1223511 RepID=A0A511DEF2_9PSEU|nr:hypothetical protein [Pseudonocardia sulfidoxydans]GEL23175.1 hypothetical protein PSU4_21290 [Pseudonocardia sulfidoxydans NBRC 16205]
MGDRTAIGGRARRISPAAVAVSALVGLVVGQSFGNARAHRGEARLGAILDDAGRLDLGTGRITDAAGRPRGIVDLDGAVRDRSGRRLGVYDDASATFRDTADRAVAGVDERTGRIRR